jgi:hypothetical protein
MLRGTLEKRGLSIRAAHTLELVAEALAAENAGAD